MNLPDEGVVSAVANSSRAHDVPTQAHRQKSLRPSHTRRCGAPGGSACGGDRREDDAQRLHGVERR